MSLCPKVRSSSEHGETICYRAGTSGANSLVPSPVCLATALEGPFACPLGQVCLGNGWDVRVKYNNQKVCTVCRSVMRRFHWSALDVVGLVICAFCCVSSSFLSLGIWARHGSSFPLLLIPVHHQHMSVRRSGLRLEKPTRCAWPALIRFITKYVQRRAGIIMHFHGIRYGGILTKMRDCDDMSTVFKGANFTSFMHP